MGRTRVKNKKSSAQTTTSSSPVKEPPLIDALFAKAQQLLTQCDYDLAQKFALRILESAPNHAKARELLGITQLEKGELEDARGTFESLLPPACGSPDPPPPSVHLYLAQLSDHEPYTALQHYEAAVGILREQLKGKERVMGDESGENEIEIRKNIARVLVAMVEIWMAPNYDLCFDPKAEETCEALLKAAFETDPDNVEALICTSSFYISQQRLSDARASAIKAWLACQDIDDDSHFPPIPTRIELAKRAIELEEYPLALLVLQSIMASNDEVVEAWYLEGWCFFLMVEHAKANNAKIEKLSWEELAKEARDCLETCKRLHAVQDHVDEELLEHTVELIGQLDALGITPSSEEQDDEDDREEVAGSDEDIEMS